MMRALAVVAVVIVACGGPKPPDPSTPRAGGGGAPAILANVPADTPYLLAALGPTDPKLRKKMVAGLEKQLEKALSVTASLARSDRGKLDPWVRALLVVLDELRDKPAIQWMTSLGLSGEGRFTLYGLGVWPVIRVETIDSRRVREVIERALGAAGVKVVANASSWRFSFGGLAIVGAITDRELVVTLVPDTLADAIVPHLLGKPAHPLSVQSLVQRYRLSSALVGFVDTRRLAAIATRPTTPLDAPLRDATGPISDACKADVERIAAVVPRIVFGYRHIDVHSFDLVAVAEVPGNVTAGLAAAHTSVPGVTAEPSNALVKIGVAARSDEVYAWLGDVSRALRDRPFACEWLHDLNDAGTYLAQLTSAPLPPVLQGAQGVALTIDELSITPLRVRADVLLVGEHVFDLVGLAGAIAPIFANPPQRDGVPVEIPTGMLGLPVPIPAHIAARGDRLAIAAGDNSEHRVVERLDAVAPERSPLLVFAFDAPRFQALLDATGKSDASTASRMRDLGKVVMRVDAGDTGVTVSMAGTWSNN